MRLPSPRRFGEDVQAASRRFPAVVLCALVGAVAAVVVDGDHGGATWVGLRVAALWGLPLLLALHLLAESRAPRWIVGAGFVGAAAGLAAFALAWRGWSDETAALRALHCAVLAHLAVAVLPWWRRGDREAYWLFHLRLLLRWLLAAVYALVLWGGLAVALGALDVLLGVTWPTGIYLQLFDLLHALFLTLYFLAGVPRRDDPGLIADEMPTALRILAQGILLPLVGVYLLILLAYLGKVLVVQDWPSGWIGWLVSAVAVAGILAFLLLGRRVEEGRPSWLPAALRLYHLLLLPALAMLALALARRVGQYGWTEPRIFLALLAGWCAGVALWRLAGGRRQWWIPASLLAVAALSYAGPWGAYATARRDQADRLLAGLHDAGLVDGGVALPASEVDPRAALQLRDSLSYLLTHHGRDAVPAVLGPALAATDTFATQRSSWRDRQWATAVVERLGAALPRDEARVLHRPWSYESHEPLLLPTGGFARILLVRGGAARPHEAVPVLRWEEGALVLDHPGTPPLRFHAGPLLAVRDDGTPPGTLVLEAPGGRLLVERAFLQSDAAGRVIEARVEGVILLRE